MLLNSIQENVEKIDEKSDTLEDKIHNLSKKLNIQEQGLHEAKQDIKTLFKSMSCLEKHHYKINPVPQSITETDKEMYIQDSNSIVISNLPNQNRDEEDLMAMFHIGVCVPLKGFRLKNIRRAESLSDRPGNITVELENVHQKINVLRNKRNLRDTNEYCNVFIQPVKSRSDTIMERNFFTILKNMPRNHNLMLASNRKIIERFKYTNTQ